MSYFTLPPPPNPWGTRSSSGLTRSSLARHAARSSDARSSLNSGRSLERRSGQLSADSVAKVFLDHSTNFPSFLARRSKAAARPPCKAARSRQAGLRYDGRIEGLFFAPLARVLSFIADNRDTQESMRWRLGSPAIKTQALSASSL